MMVILQRKEESGTTEKCMVLGMDLEGFERQLLIIFKLLIFIFHGSLPLITSMTSLDLPRSLSLSPSYYYFIFCRLHFKFLPPSLHSCYNLILLASLIVFQNSFLIIFFKIHLIHLKSNFQDKSFHKIILSHT